MFHHVPRIPPRSPRGWNDLTMSGADGIGCLGLSGAESAVSAPIRNRVYISEGRARFDHVGPPWQGIGAEPSLGECARDGIIIVQRVEHVVDAQRPEEMLVLAAQLQIDR